MKNFLYVLSWGILLLSMGACFPAQKIAYDTEKIPKHESFNPNVFLSVQTFNDVRNESEQNTVFLTATSQEAKLNGNRLCINVEKHYKKVAPVAEQMAKMLAMHILKKECFSFAVANNRDVTNYYITADLVRFSGMQKYSNAAAVGAGFAGGFGLIGGVVAGIATAGIKTKGTIVIELSDITIYNADGNQVAKIGNFRKEYDGNFPVSSDCTCIYQNVNQKLREFNEDLAQIIWEELKDK